MKSKPSKKIIKKYVKMVHGLSLTFFLITVILITITGLIAFTLENFGIELKNKTFPIFFSFGFYTVCTILSSALLYSVVRNLFKPFEDISRAYKKISKGDYSIHLNYDGKITELADTIENFNYMAQELASVEMIRNDFIANVSHEFKTPLSSLNGYLTLLQDNSISVTERNEYISKAFFSIEKLNDLTDNILRLSKLEHQTILDEPVVYRLDEQLREAIVLLEPKWNRKNIDFEIDMPEVVYKGQKSMLFQVWTNILSNAIKFSYDSGIITVKLEVSDSHCKIYIGDSGIGMTEEQQRHIFDKFYQADTSRQSQGNGLGLALCKEILLKCSGKIYVTSTSGKGTVFLVSLRKC